MLEELSEMTVRAACQIFVDDIAVKICIDIGSSDFINCSQIVVVVCVQIFVNIRLEWFVRS